jgi:hypothetical protein
VSLAQDLGIEKTLPPDRILLAEYDTKGSYESGGLSCEHEALLGFLAEDLFEMMKTTVSPVY